MSHAFPAAMAASDVNGLIDTLAPDVVLYSAVTNAPFEGREVVADTYRSVIESFEELRVTDEFENGDTHAFFWEGRIEGRHVSGADRLRLNPDGKVREITVLGRPMSGVATFLTGIGPRLARRRRGGLVAKLLRVVSLPLPPMLAMLDPVSRWILNSRSSLAGPVRTRGGRTPALRWAFVNRHLVRAVAAAAVVAAAVALGVA